MAVGISITPLAMVAALVLLSTPRARTNGLAFVAGWLIGLGLLGAVALLVLGSAHTGGSRNPAHWVSWLKIVVGLLLLPVGWYELRRHRHVQGRAATMPVWVGRVDDIKPPMSLGLGGVLAGARPKNILLVLAGSLVITQAGLSDGGTGIALLVFVVVGTVGVAVPVIIYFVMGDRGPEILDRLEGWLRLNTGAVMGVLCLVIGADLVGRGIVELTT